MCGELIAEMSKEIYEDLDPRISRLEETNIGISIHLRVTDWNGRSTKREFNISCSKICDYQLSLGNVDYFNLTNDHPLLIEHNSPSGSMYFSSKPNDPYEIARLCNDARISVFKQWNAHSFIRSDADILKSGNGLLATGPIELLQKIQELLGSKLSTNIINDPSVKKKNSDLQALIFGDSYVICENVSVIEV